MATRQHIEPPGEFVIERREVIAVVTLDPYGTEHPLDIAFRAIGTFAITHDADNEPYRLTFTFNGTTYDIASRAQDGPSDPNGSRAD